MKKILGGIVVMFMISSFFAGCSVSNAADNAMRTYIWPNGDKYEGEWKDGLKSGQGIYKWSDGSKYEGEWADGEPVD